MAGRAAAGSMVDVIVKEPIRVVLADDHTFLRRNLRMVLDDDPDVRVVAELADLSSLLEDVAALRPDVLVLDVGMSRGPLLTFERWLLRLAPETRLVLTTMTHDRGFARGVLEAGASALVLKDCAYRDLPEAVHTAAAGGTFVSSVGNTDGATPRLREK